MTVVLLVGTAACKSATTSPLQLAPDPTPPGRWSEASIENGWITVTVGLPHHGDGPYAVVLNPIVPARLLLARGIGVARWRTNWSLLEPLSNKEEPRPTASAANARKVGVWLLQSNRPGNVGRAYFQIISQEAHQSLPRVIDHLRTMPDIDAGRLAINGSSTGGFTALQAMAEEPRLAVAVVQVASGDYRCFLRSSSLALDDRGEWLVDGRMVLDDDYELEIAAIDPIGRAGNFPPRPLLLLNGAEDRAIPAACVHRTAQALEAAYAEQELPDRFEWVEFEEHGHTLPAEAQEVILDFLERRLSVPKALRGRG